MLSEQMKEELVRGLRNIFGRNIQVIILYGSVARNEATEESDIDIAIILEEKMDDTTKEQFLGWAADMDLRHERVFSVIDIQKKNMEKWGNVLPFYKNVQKEGIVLWKAA